MVLSPLTGHQRGERWFSVLSQAIREERGGSLSSLKPSERRGMVLSPLTWPENEATGIRSSVEHWRLKP